MDCIFCKIINGEIPSNKVFENDEFIAILDAFPANEGHTLIIPKKHYKNIFEIDEKTVSEGYVLAQKVAKAIKNTLTIENINILQNNGEISGQSVHHFHIHVIPRLKNDTVTIKSTPVKIDSTKNSEIANNIKIALEKL